MNAPHQLVNHEAEQSLLGGLMLSADAWDRVATLVSAEDFAKPDRRAVFRAMAQLAEQNQPLDVITVVESMGSEAEKFGGVAWLGGLAKDTPSAANVVHYARIVRESAVRRRLAEIGVQCAELAGADEPVPDLIDKAQGLVQSLATGATYRGPKRAADLLPAAINALQQRFESPGTFAGLKTGFTALDETLHGLNPGELIIVAGRPGMGKTTFAMNIAESNFVASKPVLFFSMEMPAHQLIDRSICSLGHVDFSRYRRGNLLDEDWPGVTAATGTLNAAPLHIDDTPARTPSQMKSIARRHKREHDLALIVVDYLQLSRVAGSKENRTGEISEISRSLKAMAKELDVPVMALSQLNRGLEQRPNKRPLMSDLRESGAIEQDADLILFIYRDEVYNEDSPAKGMAEIIIAKHRNGELGTVSLQFEGRNCRFTNIT